ncbi:hypothetical protein KM043_015778 [Ampulex compressa]|nr:hypothetical protein KM043_015778 [Ampulex compressa]
MKERNSPAWNGTILGTGYLGNPRNVSRNRSSISPLLSRRIDRFEKLSWPIARCISRLYRQQIVRHLRGHDLINNVPAASFIAPPLQVTVYRVELIEREQTQISLQCLTLPRGEALLRRKLWMG